MYISYMKNYVNLKQHAVAFLSPMIMDIVGRADAVFVHICVMLT